MTSRWTAHAPLSVGAGFRLWSPAGDAVWTSSSTLQYVFQFCEDYVLLLRFSGPMCCRVFAVRSFAMAWWLVQMLVLGRAMTED